MEIDKRDFRLMLTIGIGRQLNFLGEYKYTGIANVVDKIASRNMDNIFQI